MAYETGSVNNATDLVAAIQAACTAHGWTLSGQVLHKGAAYMQVRVSGLRVRFRGGTGKDGGNNLTGAGPTEEPSISEFGTLVPLAYPMTYEVHINTDPDEVYVVVNFSVDYYQFAFWGLSDVEGIGGSGMWYAASRSGLLGGGNGDVWQFLTGPSAGNQMGTAFMGGQAFYQTASNSNSNSYLHHALDAAAAWTPSTHATGTPTPWSVPAMKPLLAITPNAWNGSSPLLPHPIYISRTSGNKVTMLADLKHMRHVRLDNLDPGQILTLGSDQWKVYPWYRKNATQRNGFDSGSATHSGTMGFACRYTGA